METLKYTVIYNVEQYKKYCSILERLVLNDNKTSKDEIDLLTLLIQKWNNEHITFDDSDPIKLLKALMEEHCLKAKDLALYFGVSRLLI